MTLSEMKAAVEALSMQERAELKTYIEQTMQLAEDASAHGRAQRLDDAFEALRDGSTEAERQAIADAMNEDYIEPVDKNGLPLL